MSLVCIYVQESQFVLIMSMLKFTGVLKQWCKHKLPTLNFFRPFFLLLWLLSPVDWFCLLYFFNGLFSSESEFLHGTVIIIMCLFPNGLDCRGKCHCCLVTEWSVHMQHFTIISRPFIFLEWLACVAVQILVTNGNCYLGKKNVFLKSAAHKKCGAFLLNPILMNSAFAKNGASVWEHRSQELLVVTENLNGKGFPSLAAQILAWREAFSSFYISAVVNTECVLLCTSSLLGSLSISQLSPGAGEAAQCPLLEEEAGWSLDSPFLSGFRSQAAAPLCLAQNWALLVSLSLGNPSELQLFCRFTMLEEALGILVVGCPGTVVHLGVSGAPAWSCVCRWGRAEMRFHGHTLLLVLLSQS